jgi:hypothetical protein
MVGLVESRGLGNILAADGFNTNRGFPSFFFFFAPAFHAQNSERSLTLGLAMCSCYRKYSVIPAFPPARKCIH